jgi:hypothetical protein
MERECSGVSDAGTHVTLIGSYVTGTPTKVTGAGDGTVNYITVVNDYICEWTVPLNIPPLAPTNSIVPLEDPAKPPMARITVTLANFNPMRRFTIAKGLKLAPNFGGMAEPTVMPDFQQIRPPRLILVTQLPPLGITMPVIVRRPISTLTTYQNPLGGYVSGSGWDQLSLTSGGTTALSKTYGKLVSMGIGGVTVSPVQTAYPHPVDDPFPTSTGAIISSAVTPPGIADLTFVSIVPSTFANRTLASFSNTALGCFMSDTISAFPINGLRDLAFNNMQGRGQSLTQRQIFELAKSHWPSMSWDEWNSGAYPLPLTSQFLTTTTQGQQFAGPNTSNSPFQIQFRIGIPSWVRAAFVPGVDQSRSMLHTIAYIDAVAPTVTFAWTMLIVMIENGLFNISPINAGTQYPTFSSMMDFYQAPIVHSEDGPAEVNTGNVGAGGRCVPKLRGSGPWGWFKSFTKKAAPAISGLINRHKEDISNFAQGQVKNLLGRVATKIAGPGLGAVAGALLNPAAGAGSALDG